jgi:hypothetical protein
MATAKNTTRRKVTLDADVAKVFSDSKSVNNALRRLVDAAGQSIKEANKARRRAAS